MLKFSEFFEFSRENSYFERIRMVRMVRSLADRTFQLWRVPRNLGCETIRSGKLLHAFMPDEEAAAAKLFELARSPLAVRRASLVDVLEIRGAIRKIRSGERCAPKDTSE